MPNRLVSVIIPVYNVERYIKDCIESLLKQTYKNLEIILVDDGSTDNSCKICSEYLNYDYIKLIKQENRGVSNARNTGIQNSKGDYIIFVDPDDIVSQEFVKILVQTIEMNQTDIVCCEYTRKIEDLYFKGKIKSKLKSAQYAENKILKNSYIDGYIWNKIFKASIIKNNNLKFPNGITIWEDLYFVIKYLRNCKNVAIIKNKLYFYRVRDNSAVANEGDIRKIKDKVIVFHKLFDEYNNYNNFIIYREIKRIYINHIVTYLYKLHTQNDFLLDETKEMIKLVEKNVYRLSKKNIIKLMIILIKYKW